MACPTDLPLFNLTSRTCVASCESNNLVYDDAQHICDINRTCEEGKYFNNITYQCEKDLGTLSACPAQYPVWNNQILTC